MIIELLKDVDLFEGLLEDQLDMFRKIVTTKEYSKKETIFKEGDNEDSLYIVKGGKVGIKFYLKVNARDISPIINEVKRGDFFGEFALIDSLPRSATAVALEKTEVLVIGKKPFYDVIENHKDIGYIVMKNFLKILSFRIRQTDKKLQESLRWGWNAYKFDKD